MCQITKFQNDENFIRAKAVREKNDLLRTTFFPFLGKISLTQGVAFHPLKDEIITKVREFGDFTPDNDPYFEHDCAILKIESLKNSEMEKINVMFKIDYYDSNFEYYSDPYENKCNRVLTISLANER